MVANSSRSDVAERIRKRPNSNGEGGPKKNQFC